ncbi:MAG: hypothetical protein IT492_12565 [Gammaproteobacteria bacterium]|nr:hypothetical protein [Gammaproteobacteria bacterium]
MTSATAPHGRAVGLLVCLMIALSLAHGVNGALLPAWPAGLCVWLVAALLAGSISRFQKVQVTIMGVVGLAGLASGLPRGDYSGWPQMLEGNQAILAMLASVSFLRLVARSGAHVGERLPRGAGAIAPTLLAVHLFGAIINISAAFVVGQRISADDSLTPLQAKVVTRAFVAAACWSPLFASMAVALHYVPDVTVVQVIKLNLPLAASLLAFAAWDLRRDAEVAHFIGFPLHREALAAPLTLSTLVLGLYSTVEGWSVLTIIVIAAFCCVALLRVRAPWTETRRLLWHHVDKELPRMGGEFALFIGATVLASGVGTFAAAHPPPWVVDPATAADGIPLLFLLVVATLCGIHPVISVATLASLFPAHLTAPDVLAAVVLMAWSITLGTSPVSGTTLAMHGRFGIPSTQFLRWNLPFTAFGLASGCALLGVADYLGWA